MFLLGVMGILQTVFLPGFLVVRYLRLDDGVIKSWILSFSLSLIINHYLVTGLTLISCFNTVTVRSLYVLEAVVTLFIIWTMVKKPMSSLLEPDSCRVAAMYNDAIKETKVILLTKIGFSLLALMTIIYFALAVRGSFIPVFNVWDDIVSWNRWAIQWFQGIAPRGTHNAPQLIPTSWALIYRFIGDSSLQGFAKTIMPLFSFSILFLMLDLGLRTKQFGYIIAVSVTGFLLLYIMGIPSLTSGYVDIPVAFMAFTALYLILISESESGKDAITKNLIVGAVICAGAGITKQAGLFMVVLYPVLCYLIILRHKPCFDRNSSIKLIVVMYGIMLVLVIPWYAFVRMRIMRGQDSSEIGHVAVALNEGRSFWQRTLLSIAKLGGKLDDLPYPLSLITGRFLGVAVGKTALLAAIFSPFLLSLSNKTWKILVVMVAIPYMIVWAFFFGFDPRYLAIVIPVVGAATGFGIAHCRESFSSLGRGLSSLSMGAVLFLTAIFLLAANSMFDGSRFARQQTELRKQIGVARVNDAIYRYQQDHGLDGKIVSNYHIMNYLPGLESRLIPCGFGSLQEFKGKLSKPDVRYIIVLLFLNEKPPQEVNDYLAEKIKSRQFERLPSADDVLFLKIQESPA